MMHFWDMFTETKLWLLVFDDIIGFAVICVACVLLISYLREVPPEFGKKRIALSLGVLSAGAFSARVISHYADMDVAKENYDDLLADAIVNIIKNVDRTDDQKRILIFFAVSTIISLVSICAAAFILMRIFAAKHIVPMALVQIGGLLLYLLTKGPYKELVRSIINNDIKDDVCAYKGFVYGCFMIIIIIYYIIVTKHRYESFWTKDVNVLKHIYSIILLFVAYTFLILIYSYLQGHLTGEDNEKIKHLFQAMILLFLFVVLLYVPKRTYDITRGALREDYYEVKRKEEVDQYSYTQLQIKSERKYLHDLPGHFKALTAMAENIGADDISQYISELNEKLTETKGEFSTGNALLDNLLYDKLKRAQKNNVTIVFNGAFPEKGIKRVDITTIFHNLIENAIEASKKVQGKREIVISSKIHENRVYISISNPFREKAHHKHEKFETNKRNKEFHGYGISSVKSVVNKKCYDGTFSFKQKNSIFTADLNLKYNS